MNTTSSKRIGASGAIALIALAALLVTPVSAQQSADSAAIQEARAASNLYPVQPTLGPDVARHLEQRTIAPQTHALLRASSDQFATDLLTNAHCNEQQLLSMVRAGTAVPHTLITAPLPLTVESAPNSRPHANELNLVFGLRSTQANETITPRIVAHFYNAAGETIRSLTLDYDPITIAKPGMCLVQSGPIDLAATKLDFAIPADLQVELIALDAGGDVPIASPRVFMLANAGADSALGSPLGLSLRGCPNTDVMALRVNEGFGRCVRAGDRITITLYRECMTNATEGFQAFLYFYPDDLTFDPNCSEYLYDPYGDSDPNFTPITVSGPNGNYINLRACIDEPKQEPTVYDADLVKLCFWVNENANGPTRVGFRESPRSAYIDCQGNFYPTRLESGTDIYVDNTDPELICPPDLPLQCIADVPRQATTIEEFTDPNCCGGAGEASDDGTIWSCELTFWCDPDVITPGQGCPGDPYIVERTYHLTDFAGNSSSCTQTITVIDDTPPTFDPNAFPEDATVECTPSDDPNDPFVPYGPDVTGEPTGTDNCGGPVTITSVNSHFEPACGNTGVITRTWTIRDECGNENSRDQLITIVDTTDPNVAPPPSNDEVECDGTGIVSQIQTWLDDHGGGRATDTCGDVIWSHDFDPNNFVPGCGMTGHVNVTFTVKDECGNSDPNDTPPVSFTIVDTTRPDITKEPDDGMVECDGTGIANQIQDWLDRHGDAEAIDLCGEVSWTDNFDPNDFVVDCGMAGYIDVVFTAHDECGNSKDTQSARFTIIDTTPPTIDSCPSVSYCNAPGTCTRSVSLEATASDLCSNVTITYEIDETPITNPHTFDVGITTVTAIATDACGNSNSCALDVEITDCDAPAVTCDDDVTHDNYPGECGDILQFDADATDNCTAVPEIIFHVESDPIGDPNTFDQVILSPHFFPVGTTRVQAEAIDEAANFETCIFTVTVNDVEDPTFENCPESITLPAEFGLCSATATWAPPAATDNCEVAEVTSTQEPGFAFPVGDTEVTYTATDIYGNDATCSFTVTVTDTQPPAIENCPEDIEVPLPVGQSTAFVTWTEPTATDNCEASEPNAPYSPGHTFPPGTTTVTYTTSDPTGNTASCSFDVTVQEMNELWVSIELGPPEAIVPLTTRCITFQLWNCFFQTWTEVDREIVFTNGQALNTIVYVPAGNYQCILARDKFHSLWQRDDYFSYDSGHYVASFTGDPAAGGNWLVCGDVYADNQIDIIDFAAMLTETAHAPYPSGDTLCDYEGWHGDIDGDSAITSADFTFVHVNFGETMDPNCCGAPLFRDTPPSSPRTSIRLDELDQLGLSQLRAADRNGDGIIDQRDIAAYYLSQHASQATMQHQRAAEAIKD